MPLANLITNALAFLAFVVAFYALLARERKTPYITNYIFPPAALMFVSVLLVLAEQLLQARRMGFAITLSGLGNQQTAAQLTHLDHTLISSANACVFIGGIWIVSNIWRLHNRQVNFRDDNRIKNLRLVRRLRYNINRLKSSRSYEHAPEGISLTQVKDALDTAGFNAAITTEAEDIRTLGLCGYSLRYSDQIISALTTVLLQQNWLVQYTTCARHPYEWVEQVKRKLPPDSWAQSAERIAVVDGYTPHFGFTDSIHAVKTALVRSEGVSYVDTPESYAGIHTATAQAFNALKGRSSTKVRRPTLLIYEGCRSLVDLESLEQYRIFLRHVLTSERMWGGMVTVFVEPETDESSLSVIRTYSDGMNVSETAEVSDAPHK